jgi:hypothetical protein
MTFTPLTNYAGYNHILQAGAHWTHKNGNTYCCACEQKGGAKQNLSVYRMRPGGSAWELVKRYLGTVDSAGHITMGGASIEQDGSLLVSTSLIIPGAEKVTTTGFVGCWIREPNVDESWTASSTGEPGPPGPAGAGGITLLPSVVTAPSWEGRTLQGGVMVDIPATFGVPSASSYLVRFVASASAANVRVRAGAGEANPFYLTLNTQIAGVQMHTQGWVPGPSAWVSAVNGAALVWLQLVGFSV